MADITAALQKTYIISLQCLRNGLYLFITHTEAVSFQLNSLWIMFFAPRRHTKGVWFRHSRRSYTSVFCGIQIRSSTNTKPQAYTESRRRMCALNWQKARINVSRREFMTWSIANMCCKLNHTRRAFFTLYITCPHLHLLVMTEVDWKRCMESLNDHSVHL